MSDEGITRRNLLRGVLRERAPQPSRKAIVKPGQSLPDVISWLDPEMRATTRRNPEGPMPLLRPPGALAEADFLEACTRCNDCAEACPPAAIRPASSRFRDAEGTPLIDPLASPCRMCEDLPCIAACEPGALRPEAPAALGTARVQIIDCLNQLGSSCSVCIERCPVDEAITLLGSLPAVDERLCTGCGICQNVCPAPQNAILLLPNANRPTRRALDSAAAASPPEAEFELPQLQQGELAREELEALFRDLAALAEIEEIRFKQRATDRAEAAAANLDDALASLLAGSVRAVQIRYRYGDEAWCDTILASPEGHRVVRMAAPVIPTGAG